MNDTSRGSTPPTIDINIDNGQFAMIMTNNQHIARVGPLGFMCLPDDEIPGNAGLLDQVSSDGLFGTTSLQAARVTSPSDCPVGALHLFFFRSNIYQLV